MKLLKFLLVLTVTISSSCLLSAQYEYEPSELNPYGLPNPDAPSEIQDYQDMIGICNCKSYTMVKDREWGKAVDMTWEFKYIMNGMAIQDQTIKDDGVHSGSIRQFNMDDGKWYVYYYSVSSIPKTLQTWTGSKKGNDIILYSKQKAPNGMDGYYRIKFYNTSSKGFKWIGEWVNLDETITFPLWKINCDKVKN